MVVMSTNFQHTRIRQIRWLSPDQNTGIQIDHIIINANKKGVIEDVWSMRGPNIDLDHFLVKAVIKQKLSVIHKKNWNQHWNGIKQIYKICQNLKNIVHYYITSW